MTNLDPMLEMLERMEAGTRWAATTMRLLGQLGTMTTTQIGQAVSPGVRRSTVRRRLISLQRSGEIWRRKLPAWTGARARLGEVPDAWGLTTAGAEELREAECVLPPEDGGMALLATNRTERLPGIRTQRTQVRAAGWGSALLAACVRNGLVDSVLLQAQYPLQPAFTLDLLAMVQLSDDPQRPEDPFPTLRDDIQTEPGQRVLRYGVVVDEGGSPETVRECARAYRELHASGAADTLLGGPIIPVVLVGSPMRMHNVTRLWQGVWPTSHGVITIMPGTTYDPREVLWGAYGELGSGAPRDLLQTPVADPATGAFGWAPVTTREEWERWECVPAAA